MLRQKGRQAMKFINSVHIARHDPHRIVSYNPKTKENTTALDEARKKPVLMRMDIFLINWQDNCPTCGEETLWHQFVVNPRPDGSFTPIPSNLRQFVTDKDMAWIANEAKLVAAMCKQHPEFLPYLG